MSEESIVTIIVALLSSGSVGALISAVVALRRGRTRGEEPVMKKDAEAAEAHGVRALALELVEELRTQLDELRAKDRERQEEYARLSGVVAELRSARDQDARQIGSLRSAVQLLMGWAQDIHARWHVIRLEEHPPDLPHIDTN